MAPLPGNTLLLLDSSLELVPEQFRSSDSCRRVHSRFGVSPDLQILDDNYHHDIVSTSKDQREKRGRPDVVHFALLDATSTPLFQAGFLHILVHTIRNQVIEVRAGTRLPRTLHRFNGVVGKLLGEGQTGGKGNLLRLVTSKSASDLLTGPAGQRIIGFSRLGEPTKLRRLVHEYAGSRDASETLWVVGGFPHGHFSAEVSQKMDKLVSISKEPLPAHVVTARLSYDLELDLGIS